MKEATKRAASEALAQMLAVTAMLVIASILFYGGDGAQVLSGSRHWVGAATKQSILTTLVRGEMDCFACSASHV